MDENILILTVYLVSESRTTSKRPTEREVEAPSHTESVSSVRSRTTSKRPTEREVEAPSHRMKKHKQADVVGMEMTMMKNMSQLLEYKIERHQNSESEGQRWRLHIW